MDYGELKKKYGSSEGQSGKDALIKAGLAVVAIAIVAPILYLFYVSSGSFITGSPEKTLSELVSAGATGDTTDLANAELCSNLAKHENEWIISGCTDDITINVTMNEDGTRSMKVCDSWTDGRSVLVKSSQVLRALGLKADCEPGTVTFLKNEGASEIYNVCGNNVYMRDGCIV